MTLNQKFQDVEVMFKGQEGSLGYDELCEASNKCEQIASIEFVFRQQTSPANESNPDTSRITVSIIFDTILNEFVSFGTNSFKILTDSRNRGITNFL